MSHPRSPMPSGVAAGNPLPAHLHPVWQRAEAALGRRDAHGAEVLFGEILAELPTFGPALQWIAQLQLRSGRVTQALEVIRRLRATAPNSEIGALLEVQALTGMSDHVAARPLATGLLERAQSMEPAFWEALGTQLQQLNLPDRALAAYDQGLKLAPRSPSLLYNRATVRRFVGDLTGAEGDYDAVIALRPDDGEAWHNRADLRVQTPDRNHVAALKARLTDSALDWRQEVQLSYALAKELEDLGEYDSAFAALLHGAKKRRAHLVYDVRRDEETVDQLIEAFPLGSATTAPEAPSGPIFVLGLPRSGSTLIERILSSHPAVDSAGELPCFAQAVVHCAAADQTTLTREALIRRSAAVHPAELGAEYLRRAASLGWSGRFTDKMPLNYLYVGLIARALPACVVVHVERHPMASCYAMLKALFHEGYPFSYDLSEIARYYIAYDRLMRHWHQLLPGRLCRVRYEDLIAQQETVSQRLVSAAGLSWDPACLRFEHNPRPTTTASASQVRRALYGTAVDRWRHYEAPLSDLRAQLLAGGIDIDMYEAGVARPSVG